MTSEIADGDNVEVIAGTHRGKRGVATDAKVSKTGHRTITVIQADGARFKTLARNARQCIS